MATTSASNSSKWQRSLSVLLTFVTVVLVIACLYFARAVLIPVALAILLTFLLTRISHHPAAPPPADGSKAAGGLFGGGGNGRPGERSP